MKKKSEPKFSLVTVFRTEFFFGFRFVFGLRTETETEKTKKFGTELRPRPKRPKKFGTEPRPRPKKPEKFGHIKIDLFYFMISVGILCIFISNLIKCKMLAFCF